jgi:hypothetical protein
MGDGGIGAQCEVWWVGGLGDLSPVWRQVGVQVVNIGMSCDALLRSIDGGVCQVSLPTLFP